MAVFSFLLVPPTLQNISPEELKMELPERQPRYPWGRNQEREGQATGRGAIMEVETEGLLVISGFDAKSFYPRAFCTIY